MQTTIVRNMDTIRQIFQEVKAFGEQESDLGQLVAYLDKVPNEFLSIAYESASMVLAMKELVEGKPLLNWTKFVKIYAQQHLSQAYVGLGWAVAQEEINLGALLEQHSPFYCMRAADGAGYYDGIFRNRQTVRNLKKPGYVPEEALPAYYQGLGRSLWYLTKGIPSHAKNLLLTFPRERHPDMWRGLGIACAYVGGFDVPTLRTLLEEAGKDKRSLVAGGLLAIKSRFHAQCTTESMELCAEVWGKKSVKEIHNLSLEMENKVDQTYRNSYFEYLKQIENSLGL